MHSAEAQGILLANIEDFSPGLIFGCGQCFRFEEAEEGVFQGVAFGKMLTLAQTPEGIRFHCTQEEFDGLWHGYFAMDVDYSSIRQQIAVTPFMAEAVAFGRGIRVLRQDFWEVLCSFILSQCNNIPRIQGLVRRLCEAYGQPVPGGFAFPLPETLAAAGEDELRALGMGFRAPYVLHAAKTVAEGRLAAKELHAMPFEKAAAALMVLEGVGVKVAHCVLLYGLHRMDAFPVDVWMRRALDAYFPKGFNPGVFGEYAGVAQQYIFHYVRYLHGKTP